MKRSLFIPLGFFTLSTSALAQVVVDGTIAGDSYGAAAAVQTVQTAFGDEMGGNDGSELDAAYCTIRDGKLYLALTGNIQNNFNKLEIFIDSVPGGESSFSGTPGNDGTAPMAGDGMGIPPFTFDAGFEADYHLIVRRGNFRGDRFDFDIAVLGTPNFSSYPDVFGGTDSGAGITGTGPGNVAPIEIAYDGSNVAGVMGGDSAADQTAAAAVETGLEIAIELVDLGLESIGPIKVMAFQNNQGHDYASNQFLGGLPAPQGNLGGDEAGGFNGFLGLDMNNFAGDQFFTCEPAPVVCTEAPIVINEIRIDQPGSDNDEYFELTVAQLKASPEGSQFSLDGLTYLVIGDTGSEGDGTIEAVVELTGEVNSGGFFLVAESSFTMSATPDLIANLNFENSDNVTHMLVCGFTGASGDDLDTDNDGILDVTPWQYVLDSVSLVERTDVSDPDDELFYSETTVGPDGTFVPGHVDRCLDGVGGWRVLPFDPADGGDTPGAPNDDEGSANNYCTAGPTGATMGFEGSFDYFTNDFVLTAETVPDTFGIFFMGPQQSIPTPFGMGFNCVAGPFVRLGAAVAPTVSGQARRELNFFSNNPESIIQPGECWHFQYFFRVPPGPAGGFDLTNGLVVLFDTPF